MIRSLVSFLLLPGVVAYLIPAGLLALSGDLHLLQPVGLVPLVLGTALLIWWTVQFHSVARGTLAPWAPPERLVTSGPYRYSRNPMYVAVALILIGWALAAWSVALLVYACGVSIAFHLRVTRYEEPTLARLFGDEWLGYRSRTRRWL